MTVMNQLDGMPARKVWADVTARVVAGEKATLAVVELPPGSVVPEHRHPNEQLGVLLRGSVTFTIGDECEVLRPGATWAIPANVPHQVTAGPDGAVVVEAFAPRRADWDTLTVAAAAPLTWPAPAR
jgi:quercetin dioxygenase-like cupin family protein